MQTIKYLLVPVDFGEISASSYAYALCLAEQLAADVHLLHCLPVSPVVAGHGAAMLDMTPQLYEQAKVQLGSFIAAGKSAVAQQLGQLPEVHGTVSVLGLKEGIDAYLADHEVDLIVMGTHGVQDGWDRFFGTNTAFLVGKVASSLLVLPANTQFRPLKEICFATDLKESDLVGGTRLRKVLGCFEPRINFLHVHLPDDRQTPGALDLFRRAFEQPRAGAEATFTTVYDADVTDGIFTYLEEYPHDLLVMIKPERGWWERTFVASDTKESAGVTSLPLLILGE